MLVSDGPEGAAVAAKPSCKAHKSRTPRETREERQSRKDRDKKKSKEVEGSAGEPCARAAHAKAEASLSYLSTSSRCPYYYGDLVEGLIRDPTDRNYSRKRSGNR